MSHVINWLYFDVTGLRGHDHDCVNCCAILKLRGKLGLDWVVCVNPAGPRAGLLTFEQQGCENFEGNE